MESQSKPWNSIISLSMESLGVIGIIVCYDDYFDCFTDPEFNFTDTKEYNLGILNNLKYSRLNNKYGNNEEKRINNEHLKCVFEEFARPIWESFHKS